MQCECCRYFALPESGEGFQGIREEVEMGRGEVRRRSELVQSFRACNDYSDMVDTSEQLIHAPRRVPIDQRCLARC